MRSAHVLVSLCLFGAACSTGEPGRRPDTATNAVPATASDAPAGDASASAAATATDPVVAAADAGRQLGDSSAALWIIIASDFQCPFCRDWHANTYPQLVRDYVRTGKVRLAYVNFPLNIHANARPAAEAAMCAAAQDRFWPVHDALFHAQAQWARLPDPTPLFDSIASATRLDLPRWRSCVQSHTTAALIDADYHRLSRSGVRSTPHFYVAGTQLVGAVPFASFKRIIDSALTHTR